MTKKCAVQERLCKSLGGTTDHWEAQLPYIAKYEFSSTEHGELKKPPEKKPHQVRKPFLDALQIHKHGNKTKYTYIHLYISKKE